MIDEWEGDLIQLIRHYACGTATEKQVLDFVKKEKAKVLKEIKLTDVEYKGTFNTQKT